MKEYGRILLYFFLFVIVLSSCSKNDGFDDTPPQTSDEYFIAKEDITTYTVDQMNTLLDLAPTFFPELAGALEPVSEYLESDVQLVKITYNTTFNDKEIVASGVVSIPKTAGTYPLISFQNGTNTLNSDAPSESSFVPLLSEDNVPIKVLSMMASTGFVIAIPDYLGFGASDDMFHPYLDKESTVQTVLDMLRAVEEMIAKEEDIELNDDLYITGYSQGGWATSAVQAAIDQQYSSEFNLIASASGGGPHNLVAFTDYLLSEDTYPMPFFLAYICNSYQNLGMTTPIDSIFQQPYADKIPGLFDGSLTGGEINTQLTTNLNELLTANFIENWNKGGIYESLYSMLENNTNSGYSTTTPTLLVHGTADNYVPASLSQSLRQEFIDAGTNSSLVNLSLLDGLDHTGAVVPAELASIKWFLELKNGEN